FDTRGKERDDGMHVRRDTRRRVQRDRGPHRLDILLGNAVATKEVAGDVGAVHLEALMRARMLAGEAHVVEHGAGIEQFGIEFQAAMLTRLRPRSNKRGWSD